MEFGKAYASAVEARNKKEALEQMLKDLLALNESEFEAKYPYQYFHHYNKLVAYKLRHSKMSKCWNGNLHEKNYWIYGPAGTGKSTWARKQSSDISKIYKKNLNKWWDGIEIDNTDTVVLDEMNPGKCLLADQLKDWGDRFPFTAEIKGSAITINPGKFNLIITSNYSIEQCFENKEDQEAIKRRFNEVYIKDRFDIFLLTTVNKDLLDK